MKYVDFKKFTDENGAQPVYLFEGEEAYFREKGETLLRARFFQHRFRQEKGKHQRDVLDLTALLYACVWP